MYPVGGQPGPPGPPGPVGGPPGSQGAGGAGAPGSGAPGGPRGPLDTMAALGTGLGPMIGGLGPGAGGLGPPGGLRPGEPSDPLVPLGGPPGGAVGGAAVGAPGGPVPGNGGLGAPGAGPPPVGAGALGAPGAMPGLGAPGSPEAPPLFNCPRRPNIGRDGRPITLRANHFQISMPRGYIHHYAVNIQPDKVRRNPAELPLQNSRNFHADQALKIFNPYFSNDRFLKTRCVDKLLSFFN